jgi:hypothetical protein
MHLTGPARQSASTINYCFALLSKLCNASRSIRVAHCILTMLGGNDDLLAFNASECNTLYELPLSHKE